jgi:hypothetical protein
MNLVRAIALLGLFGLAGCGLPLAALGALQYAPGLPRWRSGSARQGLKLMPVEPFRGKSVGGSRPAIFAGADRRGMRRTASKGRHQLR